MAPIEGGDTPGAAAALATLDSLEVKGRAPKTGYSRDRFGVAWSDVDDNGCSTRNDILARDLADIRTDDDGCKVKSGTLQDPYTATVIDFIAGRETSSAVQIDHVVALSDAWQKGAQQISAEDRLALANDPLNLLAVDGPANQSKGDGDAATWLPPNRSYWCPYVSRQVEVKAKYHLWVTRAEHDRMQDILGNCTRAPAQQNTPALQPTEEVREPVEPAPAEPAPVHPVPAQEAPGAPAVSYPNCTAARAAGAAPLYAGSPGYSLKLDRDKDGVACE